MKQFRLGSTSYVYSGDFVHNARQLAGIVDDIELVLFENEKGGTNFPTRDMVAELGAIARANDLTYTAHLPRALKLGDATIFDEMRRAIDSVRALEPFAYVIHLDSRCLMQDCSPNAVTQWQAEMLECVAQIIEWVGDKTRVCVENVEGPSPDYFVNVVIESQVARCVDIGHLWKSGFDPLPHLITHLPNTRVIHLHGFTTRDHVSLAHTPEGQLLSVIETLVKQNYRGVVTLEVFGALDFFSSRETLMRAVGKVGE